MIEIARQMVASDFSINQTAQSLFIHKNTLLYKLKKYEIALNLNITGSTKGRVIFASIAMALEDRNRKDSMGYDL